MNKNYKIKSEPPLSEKEQIKLLKENTKEARTKLINSNIRLVIYEVFKRFNNTNYDTEDLISIGTIGLIRGIDTYDINKNNKLSTYLLKCIDNEIFKLLRKNHKIEMSLNETINKNEGKKIEILDTLKENCDFIEQVEKKEEEQILIDIIYSLTETQRQVIMLTYGINNAERLSQQQIGEILNLSQSRVSRILKATLEEIKEEIKKSYNQKIK